MGCKKTPRRWAGGSWWLAVAVAVGVCGGPPLTLSVEPVPTPLLVPPPLVAHFPHGGSCDRTGDDEPDDDGQGDADDEQDD